MCLLSSQRKPWGEVLDRTSFSKPSSVQEAAGRIRRNAGYFKINYLIVMLLTVAATILTHPSSLVVLGLLAASWVYMFAIRQGPLVISGKELRCAYHLVWAHKRPTRQRRSAYELPTVHVTGLTQHCKQQWVPAYVIYSM